MEPPTTRMGQAVDYVTSSKTLIIWLVLALLALIFAAGSFAVLLIFDKENPYLNDVLNFFSIAGGGSTARNVISDGVMPRLPQMVGANRDPSVAIQSPMTMTHAQGPASDSPGGSNAADDSSNMPSFTIINEV